MSVRKVIIALGFLLAALVSAYGIGGRLSGRACYTTCTTAISEYQPMGNPTVVTYGLDCVDPEQPTACTGSYNGSYTRPSTCSGVASTCSITTKTLVLIVLGQSLSANYTNTRYLPINSGVQFLDPYNSTVYQLNTAANSGNTIYAPVLGASGYSSLGSFNCPSTSGSPTLYCQGSFLGVVGDRLINDSVYSRVIFVNVAIGSSAVNDWAAGITTYGSHSFSGLLNNRLKVAWAEIVAAGWTTNPNVHIGVLYSQGEQDAITYCNGSSCPGTGVPSTAQWEAAFDTIVASYVGMGGTGSWFVPVETISNTPCCTNPIAAIQAAQSGVVGTVSGLNVYPGAIGSAGGGGVVCSTGLDSINATYRWDGTHMGIPNAYPGNNGTVLAGNCVANAIEAHPP